MTSCKQRDKMCLVYRVLLRVVVFIVLINGLAMYFYISRKYPKHTENIQQNKHKYDARHTKQYGMNATTSKHSRNVVNMIQQTSFQKTSGMLFHSRTILSLTNISIVEPEEEQSLGDYPTDAFTKEQKKNGYIVFHVIGVLYMFLGLAIVCDEFFVPALHIISKILKISDDVAGATFMAAGGSAPELFTSVIGVFFTSSNVGFGTIVGSAVFNVLFVIGMCALFSKVLLHLTWWPLLRDSLFYISALIALIACFYDTWIQWWEALIMFLIYISYVTFMIFNERIERLVKTYLFQRSKSTSSITPIEDKQSQVFLTLSANIAKNAFRNGAVQLVIHTLDPIAEASLENKFEKIKTQCDNGNTLSLLTLTNKSDNTDNVVNTDTYDQNSTCVDAPMDSFISKDIENTIFTENHNEAMQNSNTALNTNLLSNDSNEECDNKISVKTGRGDTLTNANEIIKELDEIKRNSIKNSKQTSKNESERKTSLNALNIHENNNSSTNYEQKNENIKENDFNSCLNGLRDQNVKEKTIGDFRDNKDMTSSVIIRDSVHFSTRQLSRSSSLGSCRSHRGLTPVKSCDVEDPCPNDNEVDPGEEEDGPIDFAWPDKNLERVFYVIKLPLLILLVLTLPDVRRPKLWRFFPITFIFSILWIGGFTYLMVWWTAEIGDVAGIDIDTMGLTFLAAGTSIPDLITSVVVARQGLGDMAVSSSIGSNIFDVTVGLPLPWLIYSIYKDLEPVNVKSDGLFCSTILLFIMLIAVIITIALSKWKMTKVLGLTMFFLYVVFITLTILMQFNILPCPL